MCCYLYNIHFDLHLVKCDQIGLLSSHDCFSFGIKSYKMGALFLAKLGQLKLGLATQLELVLVFKCLGLSKQPSQKNQNLPECGFDWRRNVKVQF